MNDTDPNPAIPRDAGIFGAIDIPRRRFGSAVRLLPVGGRN
ncbi:MAG: hypothetical protein OEM42_03570 [Deltaproteobacteria bacterium]|nr:hypothetical protein [Deltaproteobacteria bacterium]